jgi:hypothetical protein
MTRVKSNHSVPKNLWLRPERRLYRFVRSLPGARALKCSIQFALFKRDLRLLNKVLVSTPLHRHYWVWAGVLLGWAREGGPLKHDCDADLAYLVDDRERFVAAVPALVDAGFQPRYRFRNNSGFTTEFCFARHGVKFEFFEFRPVGQMFRYFMYAPGDDVDLELEAEVPSQPLTEFSFLGRQWMKVADHESELARIYGDWRVVRQDWDYVEDDQSVISRRPWVKSPFEWDGDCTGE